MCGCRRNARLRVWVTRSSTSPKCFSCSRPKPLHQNSTTKTLYTTQTASAAEGSGPVSPNGPAVRQVRLRHWLAQGLSEAKLAPDGSFSESGDPSPLTPATSPRVRPPPTAAMRRAIPTRPECPEKPCPNPAAAACGPRSNRVLCSGVSGRA